MAFLAVVRNYGTTVVYHYNHLHGMAVAVPDNRNVQAAIQHVR